MRCIPTRDGKTAAGFTLLELLLVIAISMIMLSIAIPLLQSAIAGYKLQAATTAVTGAIQTSRYRAIFEGNRISLAFTQNGSQYQIMRDPGTGTFSNVGNPIPFASSSVQLGADTTLLFLPSGRVQVTQGTPTLSLTYADKTKNITVSAYGNTTITQ